MKQLITVLAGLLIFSAVHAQKTLIYEDINKEYRQGLELLDVEDYVNARSTFKSVLDQTKRATEEDIVAIRVNSEYYMALSALKLLNPDGEKLMVSFIQNHTGNAKSNMAYYHLGSYYYHERDFSDAIEYLGKVSTFELNAEQRTDYNFRLGYAYFFKKDFHRAESYFARAKQSEEYYYPAHYYHGFIQFQENQYDQALSDFQKVEEDGYFGRVVPFYITSIYYQQKKYDQLIDYATPLIDDSKLKYYAEINQLLGKAYYEKGDYEKALPLLAYYAESTRRMAREDIYQLGYTQYKLGEFEDAIDNFSQLTRDKDKLAQNALYLMGNSYLQLGEKRKARNAFQEAYSLEADPFVTENALFSFAKVSYELGIHGSAINSVKDYINKYPNAEKVDEAKELLTDMFLSTRNYQEAIETIEGMDEITPKMKQAYQKVTFYRAVEMFNNKQYGNAEAYFKKSNKHQLDAKLQAQAYFWLAEIGINQKNYSQAIANYNKYLSFAGSQPNLPPATSKATAYYGMGYSYFEQEQFGSAKTYFNNSWREFQDFEGSSQHRAIKNRLYPDVILRLADCNFMIKNYDEALKQYDIVVNRNYPSKDYALYQKGMLYGIKNNPDKKIEALSQFVNNYPGSYYYDDGLFQLASAYQLKKDDQNAIRYFKRLADEKTNSPYRVQALVKLGLIHYNRREDNEAVKYYKTVAQEYQGTAEAEEALRQIKRIAIESGNPNLYVDISGANVSEQDSILYQSAENSYFNKAYEKALQSFNQYLGQFPDGYFAQQAHFYRADIYYQQEKYKEALPDYEFVINSENKKAFEEVAYLRAAKITHYITDQYDKAFEYYEALYPIASMKETQFQALEGLMETSYQTNRLDECKKYSQQVLQNEQAKDEQKLQAHYYLAKIAFKQNNLETAMNEFQIVKGQAKDEKAVESRYHLALIHFKRGELDKAQEISDDIYKNYSSYPFWLTKTLILISDIYVEKEDLTQAKFTLESIVENYKGNPMLMEEAQQKLDKVNELLDKQSKVKGPDDDPFNNENEEENQ